MAIEFSKCVWVCIFKTGLDLPLQRRPEKYKVNFSETGVQRASMERFQFGRHIAKFEATFRDYHRPCEANKFKQFAQSGMCGCQL